MFGHILRATSELSKQVPFTIPHLVKSIQEAAILSMVRLQVARDLKLNPGLNTLFLQVCLLRPRLHFS